ncbi:MAG: GntR family transcriptional regulator [Chloroflexi bacterium]|nr:GntR family transcriptional regulator [Chloroflexota bacterium]
MLSIASKASLSEQAYAIVEEMIVTLRLPPGAIFTETQLSDDIGIGRTPLREALKRLETQRLVIAIPRRGIMASEINITNQFLILETRRVLDRLIAARAARRVTVEQRVQLLSYENEIINSAERKDLTAYLHVDYEFDELIGSIARNPFAVEAAQPLHVHSRRFWYAYRTHADWVRISELHADLMHRVADGDERAAETASDLLLDHLLEFTRGVVEGV